VIPILPVLGSVEMSNMLSQMKGMAQDAIGSIGDAIGATGDTEGTTAPSFLDTLKQAVAGVNSQIASSNHAAMSYAAGNHAISLSDVMISLEKANLAFQTAAGVRDRVTDAYSSVMNMQV
jgi:flagellar hook-basal body complex protein FliE